MRKATHTTALVRTTCHTLNDTPVASRDPLILTAVNSSASFQTTRTSTQKQCANGYPMNTKGNTMLTDKIFGRVTAPNAIVVEMERGQKRASWTVAVSRPSVLIMGTVGSCFLSVTASPSTKCVIGSYSMRAVGIGLLLRVLCR